jgi:hypothetical protein
MVRAALAVLFLMLVPSAHGQNPPTTGITNTTTTPVPGVPHDYLTGLNEIVNPANGALSIRIKAPTPHERGVNWPKYVFTYDSNLQYKLNPTWNIGGTGTGSGASLQYLNYLQPTPPLAGGQTVSETMSVVINGNTSEYNNYQTQLDGCIITSGYMFTDPDGGLHSLGLGVATPAAINGAQAADCTPFPVAKDQVIGGDIQYKAFIPNPTAAPNSVIVMDTHGDVVHSDGESDDVNGNYPNSTGRTWAMTGEAAPGNVTTVTIPGATAPYQLAWEAPVTPSFTLKFTPVPATSGCPASPITLSGVGTDGGPSGAI